MSPETLKPAAMLERIQDTLAIAVAARLPDSAHANPELARYRALMRDYPLRGGKRVRGILTLLSAAAHGGAESAALPAAVALELFHSWILIHDDIEDGSEVRRGRPALQHQVGMPLALNAGDGLHMFTWRLLLESAAPLPLMAEFAHAMERTAEGQHLDLAWVEGGRFDVSEDEYLEMVRLKTAWYTVVAPLRLGTLATAATRGDTAVSPAEDFAAAGLDLGAAFQIRDDVLNLVAADASAGGYGKEAAGDLQEAKRTLILAHFFATAPEAERERARQALAGGRATRDEVGTVTAVTTAVGASAAAAQPGGGATVAPAAGDERHAGTELAWLLGALGERGSIAYAQRRAEELAATGLERLRNALVDLPDRAAVNAILTLVESLASRSR